MTNCNPPSDPFRPITGQDWTEALRRERSGLVRNLVRDKIRQKLTAHTLPSPLSPCSSQTNTLKSNPPPGD